MGLDMTGRPNIPRIRTAPRLDFIERHLPYGWHAEGSAFFDRTVIVAPNNGGITIDWKYRGYRFGWSFTGALESKMLYIGRRWRERLIADAVQCMLRLEAKRRSAE